MAILTSKAFPNDPLFLCSLAFSLLSSFVIIVGNIVCNYSILYEYTKQCTLRCITCIKTRGKRTCPQTPWWSGVGGGGLKGTVTRVLANAFTININSTNGNTRTSIKSDLYWKRLNLTRIKNFLDFYKISQNFLVYMSQISNSFKNFFQNYSNMSIF